jgi:hypothetical protein
VQKGEALAFLAGARPVCQYLVLGGHGTGSDEEPRIPFEVVDQANSDPRAVDGWGPVSLDLTPESIPELVRGGRETIIAGGCGAGRTPLADAFLEAGFNAVIGPTERYVDADSALLFVIGFFYFVLAADRDLAPSAYSDEEAVKRASRLDPDFKHGTLSYRYYVGAAPTS